MSRRGGRRLTETERMLWSAVARTAEPLHPARPGDAPPDPASAALPPQAAMPPRQVPETGRASRSPAAPVLPRPPLTGYTIRPEPVTPLGPSTPGLDRRTAERLRRGKTAPEARVDLHGHTLDRAHDVLHGFIARAAGQGMRCVLVITGKGRARDEEDIFPTRTGILKHSVPRWLTQPPLGSLVVGVFPAHARHGGGGAFYVYLRKQR